MNHDDDQLLKIGVFSTLSRISVRMLRHYQEHGILAPAAVDEFTGHRYYGPEQLKDAELVAQLRDAGFSVEKMAELLKSIDDSRKASAVVERHRTRLQAERDQIYAQLAALDHIGSTLKERPMTDVTITTLPEMVVASLRRTIPTYSDEGDLWKELMPLVSQSGASFPADGIAGATFHDPDFHEHDVDVETWIQVSAPFTATEPAQCRTEPERRIVSARLLGDYSQMPAITTAVGAYIAEHRLTTGPMFNIYHVSPAQSADPSSWITDVCFPVID